MAFEQHERPAGFYKIQELQEGCPVRAVFLYLENQCDKLNPINLSLWAQLSAVHGQLEPAADGRSEPAVTYHI